MLCGARADGLCLKVQARPVAEDFKARGVSLYRPASNLAQVCVCLFCLLFFGGSPSDQGKMCATLCNVSRGLHLFSVFFCPTRTNRGHTGGGKHRGLFLLFMFIFCPTVLLRCLPSLLSREGFGCPIPRQHQI